jgi:hypothetical protein
MKVVLDHSVYLDLLEIIEHYQEEVDSTLGAEFYDEFLKRLKDISLRPYSFQEYEDFRRVNLHKFPHHILFQITTEGVARILTVKHNRRNPLYGRDRLKPY